MRLSIACLLLQFGLQWNLKTLGGNVIAGLGRTSKEHSVDAGTASPQELFFSILALPLDPAAAHGARDWSGPTGRQG